jgi:potassium channel subfamily K, other eukaryote
MGDTVISKFKKFTFALGDLTVLPQEGKWRAYIDKYPWLVAYLQRWVDARARKKRQKEGIPIGPPNEDFENLQSRSIEALAKEAENEEGGGNQPDLEEMARRLAAAIRRTAFDLQEEKHICYDYEDWVEFTRLIRFTRNSVNEMDQEEDEGLVEWDWIGEDSPMMANQTEPQFVLDRLCESLSRYIKKAHVDQITTDS